MSLSWDEGTGFQRSILLIGRFLRETSGCGPLPQGAGVEFARREGLWERARWAGEDAWLLGEEPGTGEATPTQHPRGEGAESLEWMRGNRLGCGAASAGDLGHITPCPLLLFMLCLGVGSPTCGSAVARVRR